MEEFPLLVPTKGQSRPTSWAGEKGPVPASLSVREDLGQEGGPSVSMGVWDGQGCGGGERCPGGGFPGADLPDLLELASLDQTGRGLPLPGRRLCSPRAGGTHVASHIPGVHSRCLRRGPRRR